MPWIREPCWSLHPLHQLWFRQSEGHTERINEAAGVDFSFPFGTFRYILIQILIQFERDGDPLEKITVAEATEILVGSYRSSEYCYSANKKIEEISKIVS